MASTTRWRCAPPATTLLLCDSVFWQLRMGQPKPSNSPHSDAEALVQKRRAQVKEHQRAVSDLERGDGDELEVALKKLEMAQAEVALRDAQISLSRAEGESKRTELEQSYAKANRNMMAEEARRMQVEAQVRCLYRGRSRGVPWGPSAGVHA